MEADFYHILLGGLLVGAATSLVGAFMVAKRMALVGDALSHVALPGMGISLMLGLNPFLGAFFALFFALLFVFFVEKKTETFPEGLVGVIFTASLALGILITPESEIYESLFGSIEKITISELTYLIPLSLLTILVVFLISRKLTLIIISKELSASQKINIHFYNLIYLFLVGVVVAVGISFVGALLTGSLTVMPAMSAKNISNSMKSYLFLSCLFGTISFLIGISLSFLFSITAGPLIVIISFIIFLMTVFLKYLV